MPGLSFGLWALDKDDGVLVCTVSFWDVVDMVFQSVPNLVGWCAGYGGRRLGFFVAVVVGRVQVDRLCSVECSGGLGLVDLVVSGFHLGGFWVRV